MSPMGSVLSHPYNPEPHLLLAAILGQLGRTEEACAELKMCESISAGYAHPSGWIHKYKRDVDNEHFLDGLRKAGLAE